MAQKVKVSEIPYKLMRKIKFLPLKAVIEERYPDFIIESLKVPDKNRSVENPLQIPREARA